MPSWCDRVLWRSAAGHACECTAYGADAALRTSDHRPVYATFEATTGPAAIAHRPAHEPVRLLIFGMRVLIGDVPPGTLLTIGGVPDEGVVARRVAMPLSAPRYGACKVLMGCGAMARAPLAFEIPPGERDGASSVPDAVAELFVAEHDAVEALLKDPIICVVSSMPLDLEDAKERTKNAAAKVNGDEADATLLAAASRAAARVASQTVATGTLALPREALSDALRGDAVGSTEAAERAAHTAVAVSADLYTSGVRLGRLECRLAVV